MLCDAICERMIVYEYLVLTALNGEPVCMTSRWMHSDADIPQQTLLSVVDHSCMNLLEVLTPSPPTLAHGSG